PSPTPQPAAPAPAAAPAAPTAAAAAAAPAPQMEFNHAINYVNKIKNRFAKDPETYKTFLEILQTYQKDQRPIQEVYTQVTALFKEAPDLLDEFKAFLPDTTGATDTAPSPALANKKPYGNPKLGAFPPSAAAGSAQAKQAAPPLVAGAPSGGASSVGAGGAGAPEKKKRAAPGTSEKAKAKRAKMQHVQGVESPPIGSAQGGMQQPQQQQPKAASQQQQQQQAHQQQQVEQQPVSPYGAPPTSAAAAAAAAAAHMGHAHPYGAPPPGFPGAPLMQSAYDVYLAQHRNSPLVQPDEFGFFDRVKKHLDDRDAYTEFLKLLNLFTQEIVDVQTLLSKSLLFIGGDEHLVQGFKDLVGWDPVKDGRVRGEDWIIDNEPVLDRPRVELHLLKSYGPSYRKLPDSEVDLACSGRGPLEWSVLNDEWVAFATWASEGSGAHRKNPYEEALYNSEQERHWYSYHLESMARTIAYLEPIAARLALMPSDERAAFKLGAASAAGAHDEAVPAGAGMIGGTAPSVYERIVRKIYGKDHGWEILQALEDNPAVAVPIVLARLKQKDEEWKRAEREWNKVWREVDAKNHYRALDHQGIPFKAIDKKTTTTSKSLTAEIETLRRDKQMKRYDVPGHSVPQHPSQPVAAVTHPTDAIAASLPPPLRPHHQFELHMANRGVLFDVLKLTLSYLDRDASGFSAPERARVEAFLRLFVPLLWGVEHDAMEQALGAAQHDDADAEEDELETEAGDATDADESGVEGASEAGGSATPGAAAASPTPGKKAAPPTKRGGAADLRRRTLLHAALAQRQPGAGVNGAATTNGRVGGGARGGSPATDDSSDELGRLVEATWISLEETREDGSAVEPPSGDEVLEPRRFSFFANSTFYCLVRVMHQIYHRLLAFKQLSADLAASSASARRLNPLGVELGLSTPVPVVDTGDNPAEHYYEHMLDLAEKLFDGDVDQQTYEEQLRFMAGIRSYPLFTLDKLVSTVIKHIHTINSDNRCQDIVALLEKDRRQLVTTPRQQIAYRMEVESVLNPDENLYRLEWIPDDEALTIQLLGKEDLTLDDAHQSEAKLHQSWLASFQLTSPSEGIGAQVKAPLLKRNRVLCAAEDPQEFDLAPGLQAKERAYRLFWVKGSEDYLRRLRLPPAAATAEDDEDPPAESTETVARRRSERFRAWVDDQLFPERREERQAESDDDEAAAAARDDELEGDEGEADAVELEEGEEVEAQPRGAVPPEDPPAASSTVADASAAGAGGAGDGDVEMDEP
ncbi:hypothetical protein JCM9279_001054, partial [Rhodotorula babjevae]